MRYFLIFLFLICIINSFSHSNDDAQDIINHIIKGKEILYMEEQSVYKFNRQDSTVLSTSELPDSIQNHELFRKMGFLFEYIDTTRVANNRVAVMGTLQSKSTEYRKKSNKIRKSVIHALWEDGFYENMHESGMDVIWNEALKDVNIFNNETELLFKRFISPLSSIRAASFYNYRISDTLDYKGKNCLVIHFSPKNKYDLGFTGQLTVENNSPDYHIRRVVLGVLPETNINFISHLFIEQEYDETPGGLIAKSSSHTRMDISFTKIYYRFTIENQSDFTNYTTETEKNIRFNINNETTVLKDAEMKGRELWEKEKEKSTYITGKQAAMNPDRAGNFSWQKILAETVKVIISNYIPTDTPASTSKLDIGPVRSIFSHNDVEGYRFRLGGRTTANLNNHIFLKGYGAYGTKDEKFKYSAHLTYSFNRKFFHEYEFPQDNLNFRYQYDVNTPGQVFLYSDPDNILFSFKRGMADRMTYRREANIWYEKEFLSGFSGRISADTWEEEAAGSLNFINKMANGTLYDRGSYNATQFGLQLRYTFNEKFYQNRDTRFMLKRDGPSFTLNQKLGVKDILGSDYDYYLAELIMQKRFWLAEWGSISLIIKGGKIWGDIPYPLLILPNANQTYTIQPQAYSMMNTLEFVNDKYAAWDMTYDMNGYLFNRIPFIQKLKWREVITFKGLYGGLSKKNDPENNPELFLFPDGTYKMGNTPYMEAGFGIENIFKILRVDYVRRLTYLNNKDINKNGVRVAFSFSF